MRLLITIREDLSVDEMFYGSGYSQNIKFLYDLFDSMGHQVELLVNNLPESGVFLFSEKPYAATTYNHLMLNPQNVSIVFEIGATIPDVSRQLLREKTGCKIVSVRFGNSMVMDMEQVFLKPPEHPERLNYPGADMLWTLPHHRNAMGYFETVFDCPVRIAPYIWEPDFVAKPFAMDAYEINERDIYVMEPNVSVLKNALIPMTIVERLYRESPSAFGKANILNGGHFFRAEYFLENIVRPFRSLQADANKAYFHDRIGFDTVFQRPDILLCHQWDCELNNLYFEALYRGVPMVHNSDALSEAGYYYEGFDVQAGVTAVKAALEETDFQSRVVVDASVVSRYSIHHPEVQQQYVDLLDEVVNM